MKCFIEMPIGKCVVHYAVILRKQSLIQKELSHSSDVRTVHSQAYESYCKTV